MAATDEMNGETAQALPIEQSSCSRAFEFEMLLFTSSIVPYMALKAALKLDIPSIIAKKVGIDGSMSIQDIVAEIPCKSAAHTINELERLFVVLVQNRYMRVESVASETGNLIRLYGLGVIGKNLVRHEVSYLPCFELTFHDVMITSWFHIHEYIVDENIHPVQVAHGTDYWSLVKGTPGLDETFNRAMEIYSIGEVKSILCMQDYHGFESIKTLVDVGGGNGKSLSMIREVHPHIHGINFDLPHVIAEAPNIREVEHISGDMFESVPSGDAIMIKRVLHDWSDERCIKILRNCHAALPPTGKVMIMQALILEDPLQPDASPGARILCNMDLNMMLLHGGQGRSSEQYKNLLMAAGFPRMEIFTPGSGETGILEGYLQ